MIYPVICRYRFNTPASRREVKFWPTDISNSRDYKEDTVLAVNEHQMQNVSIYLCIYHLPY